MKYTGYKMPDVGGWAGWYEPPSAGPLEFPEWRVFVTSSGACVFYMLGKDGGVIESTREEWIPPFGDSARAIPKGIPPGCKVSRVQQQSLMPSNTRKGAGKRAAAKGKGKDKS